MRTENTNSASAFLPIFACFYYDDVPSAGWNGTRQEVAGKTGVKTRAAAAAVQMTSPGRQTGRTEGKKQQKMSSSSRPLTASPANRSTLPPRDASVSTLSLPDVQGKNNGARTETTAVATKPASTVFFPKFPPVPFLLF